MRTTPGRTVRRVKLDIYCPNFRISGIETSTQDTTRRTSVLKSIRPGTPNHTTVSDPLHGTTETGTLFRTTWSPATSEYKVERKHNLRTRHDTWLYQTPSETSQKTTGRGKTNPKSLLRITLYTGTFTVLTLTSGLSQGVTDPTELVWWRAETQG